VSPVAVTVVLRELCARVTPDTAPRHSTPLERVGLGASLSVWPLCALYVLGVVLTLCSLACEPSASRSSP